MRKVFIDVGAMDGDTVKKFIAEHNDASDYEIYAIEPNPNYRQVLEDLISVYAGYDITFLPWAAWDSNTEKDFTVRPLETPYGSTLMKEKRDWGKGQIVKVKCFDFAAWLKQFDDALVTVKMDIEGAEFFVLKRMIELGSDELIDLLQVEFHESKLGGNSDWNRRKKWILDNLKCPWENHA